MARFKLNIALVLLISSMISYQPASSFNPASADKVLKYLADIDPKVRMIGFWIQIFTGLLKDDVKNSEIMDEVKGLSRQLSEMGFHLDQKIDIATSGIPKRVRADADVDQHIRQLITKMTHVDFVYEIYFTRILKNPNDTVILREYVDKVLKYDKGISASVYDIYRLIHEKRENEVDKRLLHRINNRLKVINNERCDESTSPQQWLYYIYLNIMLTEIRAYILTVTAYSIEAQLLSETRQASIDHATGQLLSRVGDHLKVIREELSTTPRDVRRCDPPSHRRAETFIEFEKLMQPYIVNEAYFPVEFKDKCPGCADTPHGNGDLVRPSDFGTDKLYRGCNGTISNCGQANYFFHRSGQVCVLPEYSVKRYGWMKSYSEKVTYGDDSKCDGTIVDAHAYQLKLWSAPTLGDSHYRPCKYCLCLCSNEFNPRTLRSVSIRNQVANYSDNMVVTGVRLVQKNRLIHIQIKQGKLKAAGKIEPGSESWIPLEDMNFSENSIVEVIEDKRIHRTLYRGQDYVFINELNNNLVLEDVMAKKGEVIVGVAFTAVERRKARDFKALALRIMTAPFNWTTGEVGEGKWQRESTVLNNLIEAWKQSDNIRYMVNLDDPVRSKLNFPNIQNTIIRFSISDVVKDAGQRVVPFFDALPVEPNPGFPLDGIGLFHKASPGYGGYITPRIHNADLTDYMSLDNFV